MAAGETISVSFFKAQVIMQQSEQSTWLVDQNSWPRRLRCFLQPDLRQHLADLAADLLSLVLQISDLLAAVQPQEIAEHR